MHLYLLLLSVALVLLLLLNAFFVLAEFAIVKLRPSRVDQLASGGDRRGLLLREIHAHLDEYLSVCQVGITLASVALGMVGEKTADAILGGPSASTGRYLIAMAVSYVVISGSHIVLGELVPKSMAIRLTDKVAIRSALPLRFFHTLFYPILWLLTRIANGILRLLRIPPNRSGEDHSEQELRIILDQSQERGVMSFRRLLFMENVFDFGALVVRDAMRIRAQVRTLDGRLPWSENFAVIRTSHFTRYPLVTSDPPRPTGFVHVKDLALRDEGDAPDLAALARPLLATTETTSLEALFAEMQRRRIHMALVADQRGEWTGLITFEDILEELVGTIRDEFEEEERIRLGDVLPLEHIHLDVVAPSATEAVRRVLSQMDPASLPLPARTLLDAVAIRDRLNATYLGDGVALPHARIPGLTRPFVLLLRSTAGLVCQAPNERAHLLFVLLTPAGRPRVHQALQSTIATLLHESEYVKEHLLHAATAADILEIIRTGEQAVLD